MHQFPILLPLSTCPLVIIPVFDKPVFLAIEGTKPCDQRGMVKCGTGAADRVKYTTAIELHGAWG